MKGRKGQASGGLPAGGFKHSGSSEVLLSTIFFFPFLFALRRNGGHVLERGGLAGKHVRECPC